MQQDAALGFVAETRSLPMIDILLLIFEKAKNGKINGTYPLVMLQLDISNLSVKGGP